MSLARIYSRAQVGINAPEVIVEVHLGTGLPAFHIVGLPEASVKESKDRVRSALENSQFGTMPLPTDGSSLSNEPTLRGFS